jgi:hypothetical protein
MTLDASGNLGVGTTSPDSRLVVQGSSGTYAQIKDGTVNTFIQARSADSVGVVGTLTNHGLALWTNSAERARIDSSGNLLVGTTASNGKLTTYNGTVGASATTLTPNATLWMDYAGGTGNNAGSGSSLVFSNSNVPSNLNKSAAIGAPSEDTGGLSRSIGLSFWTSAFDANRSERMRLDSNGNLLVGITSNNGSTPIAYFNSTGGSSDGIWVANTNSAASTLVVWNKATTGNNAFQTFGTEGTITTRGSISYNRAGGLVVYNTTSDYRAKDISGPVTNSGALIDSVPVYMGKMKWATEERPMFIAHETPVYAHTGEKDAVDKDGNPVYQQMDASALIPVMWAEIQSLRQRVAQLESN